MAQWLNPETGEWEEKPDEGTNAFSTGGATSVGTGLPSIRTQTSQPTWSFDGGDWARQNEAGITQFKNLDGTWSDIGRGEHSESQGYIANAVNDPNVDKIVAYQRNNPNGLNNEQQAFFSNPIGMLDSYGQGSRWGLQDLFDNKFNEQQAGFLDQTGGSKYLSPADIASGRAFNFRESAAEQSKRAEAGGGLFGLGDMGIPLALAAMYFTGPAGAGLWGGEAAALGAGELAAADMAGGLLPEFGGLSSYSAGIGELGSMADLSGGLLPDFNISNLIGDPSYWPSSLGEAGNTLSNLPTSFEVPSSVTNMEQGFRELSQLNNPSGWNTSPLNPEASALENTSSSALDSVIEPKQYIDDYGVGTNSTGDMVNAKGQRAWQDVLSEKLRPSLGIDGAGSTVNNMSNIWNKLTTPLGGNKMNTGGLANLFKAPTPLELGVRGFGAWDSWNQGKKAQSLLEQQLSRSGASADSNAARGMTANDLWTKTQTDPMFGYGSFMAGAGRDFVNNARAAAAKGGNRGSYLNTGRMQSDLASLWQKNQTQRAASIADGFANSPYASMDSVTPAYANLVKRQNAPIFQGIQGALDAFKLADLFT